MKINLKNTFYLDKKEFINACIYFIFNFLQIWLKYKR